MWCMHCGQDVPWTASAKDGRLVCSRCGLTPSGQTLSGRSPQESVNVQHGALPEDLKQEGLKPSEKNVSERAPTIGPINDLHGAHRSEPSDSQREHPHSTAHPHASLSKTEESFDGQAWPVSSAYDGWGLDEQLSHIRDVLDSISSLTSSEEAESILDAEQSADATSSATRHRIDAMHPEKRGRHRRTTKRDPLVGRFAFGLVFLVLGTSTLVLSIASILPRQIWYPADVPIGSVLLQVIGAFLLGLGLAGLLRRFQAALQTQEATRPRRRIDEPQLGHRPPYIGTKVRS